MCGIVALWDPAASREGRERTVGALANALAHRGPDGQGLWSATLAPVTLGHRRLAIQGLGEQGAQPMTASPPGTDPANARASGLTFNGELFGADDLRRELQAGGAVFRGTSDTEILLHALLRWGLPGALDRVRGQLAFAFFDAASSSLFFARDRAGIRPLLFARRGDRFALASEQKALLPLAWVERTPSPAAGLRYLALQRTDDIPYDTLVGGIRSLPAGHWGRWDGRTLHLAAFGRVDDAPPPASVHDVRRELDRAVDEQLVGEVPVAAMVSGGLDSSTVALLADRARLRRGASEPMHLFAYHDDAAEADERPYQQAVLDAFRSPHEVHWVSSRPSELLAGFTRYVHHQEEPYGDVSSFAEYCIAERARSVGAKVLLGGLGGDEVFLGYPAYIGPLALELIRGGSLGSMRALLMTVSAVTQGAFGRREVMAAAAYHALPARLRNALTGFRAARPAGLDARLTAALVVDAARTWHRHDGRRPANAALRGSIESWSVPRYLAHSDRMGLAWGVENRVPLLDDGVIRAAFGIPAAERISAQGLKAALRLAMTDALPPVVRDRSWKLGFHAPVGAYVAALDEPLRQGFREAVGTLGAIGVRWESLPPPERWRWGALGAYWQWVRERPALDGG